MTRNSLLALVQILVLVLGIFIVKPSYCSGSDFKVGLFYYVWYTGTLGQGHWNGTPTDDPESLRWKVIDELILGFYNSSDPKAVKQHLDWFKELGIDFLIVSWFGSQSLGGSLFSEDNATKTLFKTVAENNYPIQVVIMVEEFGNYDFQAIYDYIYNEYANVYTNEYFRLDDKPLVCWWNHPSVTGTDGNPNLANIQSIMNDSRFEARIVGHDDYVNWSAWRPCSLPEQDNFTDPPRLSQDGFVCIEPRYDDSHIGRNNTFDEDYSQGLYDRQWNWVIEHKADIRIAAIYSWNEYHERSQIEPHNTTDGKYVLLPFSKTYRYIVNVRISEFQEKALAFLEVQLNNYANDKWLCRATPNSSEYWIYNDNYLAYKILDHFNRSEIADKIRETIEAYNISIDGNDRLEVLFNKTISFPPYNGAGQEHSPTIDSSSNGEKFTVRNDVKLEQITDWEQYADLLLYGVIDRYIRGDVTYQELWNKAVNMFDGKGMADHVFDVETNGTKYETYKLALFVIASRIIGNHTDKVDAALGTILKLQNQTNGGVITHYLVDLTPDPNSMQNVETTSFSIIATIPEFPSFLILPLFFMATLLAVIIYRRKHPQNE